LSLYMVVPTYGQRRGHIGIDSIFALSGVRGLPVVIADAFFKAVDAKALSQITVLYVALKEIASSFCNSLGIRCIYVIRFEFQITSEFDSCQAVESSNGWVDKNQRDQP